MIKLSFSISRIVKELRQNIRLRFKVQNSTMIHYNFKIPTSDTIVFANGRGTIQTQKSFEQCSFC